MNQKLMRFSLPRITSEPEYVHRLNERIFNEKLRDRQKICPEKLFADLLKRLARRAVSDVTECDSEHITAPVARLRDLMEIFDFSLRHQFRETPEARMNFNPLRECITVADWLHVLRETQKTHRAPAFVNHRDDDIADIRKMFGTLAGLVSVHPLTDEILTLSGQGSEVSP